MTVTPLNAGSGLPDEFYSSDGLEEVWKNLRHTILTRLVNERDECDMLDTLLMERASYLYAHVRQKESNSEGFSNDRAYKETYQLLIAMLQDLRKVRDRENALDEAKVLLVMQVKTVVEDAVKDLPSEQQQVVLGKIIGMLEDAA